MLSPTRTKYRKQQKGKRRGKAQAGNDVAFGDYALLATADGWITSRQIEASRVAINRKIRKFGRLWIRLFPDKPISKKPLETRMGKGKGAPEMWVAVIKPGRILFEIEGIDEKLAREALALGAAKLPVKTKVVRREVFPSRL